MSSAATSNNVREELVSIVNATGIAGEMPDEADSTEEVLRESLEEPVTRDVNLRDVVSEVLAREVDAGNPAPSSFDMKEIREALKCLVCFDVCYNPCTLGCQHSFCRGCIADVKSEECPKCRAAFVLPAGFNIAMDTVASCAFPDEYQRAKTEAEHLEHAKSAKERIEDELRRRLMPQIAAEAAEARRAQHGEANPFYAMFNQHGNATGHHAFHAFNPQDVAALQQAMQRNAPPHVNTNNIPPHVQGYSRAILNTLSTPVNAAKVIRLMLSITMIVGVTSLVCQGLVAYSSLSLGGWASAALFVGGVTQGLVTLFGGVYGYSINKVIEKAESQRTVLVRQQAGIVQGTPGAMQGLRVGPDGQIHGVMLIGGGARLPNA